MGNLSSHETVETLREYQDPYNFESYDDWIAPISNDEAKTFYDLLLRLGSYPYISNPPPGRHRQLDFLTFKCGLMSLSGRLPRTTPNASGFKFGGAAGRKRRRILFMALQEDVKEALTPEDEMTEPRRTEEDDEDLIDVIRMFEAYRWEGPNPCLTYQGPRIPHRTAFRSSRSVPQGMVGVEKIRQLLKRLLVVKLWCFGIDLDAPSVQALDWGGAIQVIMASGGIDPAIAQGYVKWPEFDRIFATIPRASEALGPLFKPFISPSPTTALNTTAMIQKQNAFISHHLTHPPGFILTLPVLAQILSSTRSNSLYTTPPLNALSLASYKVEYTGPLSIFESFLSQLPQSTRMRKQALIMIEGTTLTTNKPFTGGIYLNNNLDEFTTSFVFQTQPINRSFAADREPGEPEHAERMCTSRNKDMLGTVVRTAVEQSSREAVPLRIFRLATLVVD
ncbi:hypothetical protein E6O75_ATG03423 [Venturia nashicola]|uniref:Uncharacterized protein n=1 Tax=Venturia nashicola TaxID=86259 RepID=A0A4Z1P4R1_9PEZI|nr:hypothetical protein E6O75_ATG03423 [Venturia nashicola]